MIIIGKMRSCETGSVRMSVLLKCDDVNTLNGIEWYGSSPSSLSELLALIAYSF